MEEILYTQASYSLTKEQIFAASKKINSKQVRILIMFGVAFIIIALTLIIKYLDYKYLQKDMNDRLVIPLAIAIVLFVLGLMYLGLGVSSTKTTANRSAAFFEEYSVNGVLTYVVEITESEIILECKDNVTHMTKKCVQKVVDVKDYVGVIFTLGTLLIIPKTTDTEQVIKAFTVIAPAKPAKK